MTNQQHVGIERVFSDQLIARKIWQNFLKYINHAQKFAEFSQTNPKQEK